jgi:hypothetical protein
MRKQITLAASVVQASWDKAEHVSKAGQAVDGEGPLIEERDAALQGRLVIPAARAEKDLGLDRDRQFERDGKGSARRPCPARERSQPPSSVMTAAAAAGWSLTPGYATSGRLRQPGLVSVFGGGDVMIRAGLRVLVTGGGSGIGWAIAVALHAQGA